MSGRWFIMAKAPGSKRFKYLTPRGGLNGLKMYAAPHRDQAHAERTIGLNENAVKHGYEFRAVPDHAAPAIAEGSD